MLLTGAGSGRPGRDHANTITCAKDLFSTRASSYLAAIMTQYGTTEIPDIMEIAILIDEFRSEDPQTRLNSVRRLEDIATTLGKDRTREELLPFLHELSDDEEPEVLQGLAEELGRLVDLVGGSEHAHTLLKTLETLSQIDEVTVRDASVSSLNRIIDSLSDEHVLEYAFPIVKSLSTGNWFSQHISACGLYCSIYSRVPKTIQKELRTMFIKLCADEIPMARRAACSQLGPFAIKIENPEIIQNELFEAHLTLSKDDQDSVRVLCFENCIAFATIFDEQFITKNIIPIIKAFCEDSSWRVRWMSGSKMGELCRTLGEEMSRKYMIDPFSRLLQDREPEVRNASVQKISEISENVGAELSMTKLMPAIKKLVYDECVYVRSSMASNFLGISHVIDKKDVVTHVVPLFLHLLKDDNSDVRLGVLGKLDDLSQIVGPIALSNAILPAIITLANDHQWRVRLGIIKLIPLFSRELGATFFKSKLNQMCRMWLGDKVFAIREAATANLLELTMTFGIEWSEENVVTWIVSLSKNPCYLYRQTALNAIKVLCPPYGSDVSIRNFMPILTEMTSDPVPNIRFMLAKNLVSVITVFKKDVVDQQLIPLLRKLQNDPDFDVRWFSSQTISKLTGENMKEIPIVRTQSYEDAFGVVLKKDLQVRKPENLSVAPSGPVLVS